MLVLLALGFIIRGLKMMRNDPQPSSCAFGKPLSDASVPLDMTVSMTMPSIETNSYTSAILFLTIQQERNKKMYFQLQFKRGEHLPITTNIDNL